MESTKVMVKVETGWTGCWADTAGGGAVLLEGVGSGSFTGGREEDGSGWEDSASEEEELSEASDDDALSDEVSGWEELSITSIWGMSWEDSEEGVSRELVHPARTARERRRGTTAFLFILQHSFILTYRITILYIEIYHKNEV